MGRNAARTVESPSRNREHRKKNTVSQFQESHPGAFERSTRRSIDTLDSENVPAGHVCRQGHFSVWPSMDSLDTSVISLLCAESYFAMAIKKAGALLELDRLPERPAR